MTAAVLLREHVHVLLLALAQAAPAESPAPTDARARVDFEPARAEVGEPVLVTLSVEHAAASRVVLPAIEPGILGSWTFVESLGVRREVVPGDATRVVERASWRAFALEGEAEAPAFSVTIESGGATHALPVEVAAHAIRPALAAGEDAPRPAKGFREPVEWTGGEGRVALVTGVLVLLVLAGGVALVLARRRRRADPVAAADPAQELSRLAPDPRDATANRDVVYALTRIARSAVDRAHGVDRRARTDPEWLAAVESDAAIPEPARAAARRLVARAEAVKYAGLEPTIFATEEALADARAVVEGVANGRRAA